MGAFWNTRRLRARRSFSQRQRVSEPSVSQQPSRWWVPLSIFLCSMAIATYMVFRQSVIRQSDQLGMVVISGSDSTVSKSLTILIVKAYGQGVTVIPLPDDLSVETLDKYGVYKGSSLHGLASLEKLPVGFLLETLQLHFGIGLQQAIWEPTPPSSWSKTSIQDVIWKTAIWRNKSTLGVVDRIKIWWSLRSLKSDNVAVIDLRSSNMVKPMKEKTPGLPVLHMLDIVSFDALASQELAEAQVRKEGQTVAVVNASQVTGVGTRVARMLSNMGMDVISVGNASQPVETSNLYFADKEKQKLRSYAVLQQSFDLPSSAMKMDPAQTLNYRADFVLILGTDWGERLER